MKKIINNMSGVTLFALTITIIVLLILTGVTSSVILSQNGIIENATKAREEATIVEEMEQIDTAYSATTIRQTSRTTITTDDATKLQEELFKNVDGITVSVDIDEDGTKGFLVKFEKTGHYYFIENNEVRTATEEEFNDHFTNIFAILYKRTNAEGNEEYDLRFNATGTINEENGWTQVLCEQIQTLKLDENGKTILDENGKLSIEVALPESPIDFPWYDYRLNITSVTFEEKIVPKYTRNWFYHFENLTTITNIGKLHTHYVTDMRYMFYHCHRLENLDVSTFNTSNVTTMRDMFAHCTSLKELDLSHFNTSKVTDMYHMFYDCPLLQSLILDNWNTGKVTNMDSMFAECTSLTQLDLSSFITWYHNPTSGDTIHSLNTTQYMFNLNTNLKVIDMRQATFDNVTTYGAMFSGLSDSIKIIVKDSNVRSWILTNFSSNFPNENKNIILVSELITE